MYAFKPKEQEGLEIRKVETSKDKIEQPPLAKDEKMYIPPLGSSIVISGKSGSGKSTLLANLITDGRFYGKSPEKPDGWFDKIFLFSPTAQGDDVQKALGIPSKYVFTDLSEAPELLEVILDTQQKKVDKSAGADKVAQFCIIFDDIIGDTKFMNTKEFTRCFYQVRHVNCTTFICTQHFHRVPKICRLQANFIFFFQGSASEVDVVVEDYAPPMYSKNEFKRIINDATRDPHSFLTINMKKAWDLRLRRNLDEFIHLSLLVDDQKDENTQKKPQENKPEKSKNYEHHSKAHRDFETALKLTRANVGTDEQAGRVSQQCQKRTTREGFDGRCNKAARERRDWER